MKLAALAALLVCARVAAADPAADAGADAERAAFNAAVAREDIAALEQLGAMQPPTRWTDDAWAEAARLALKASDYARARRALEHVIAIGADAQLVRRARNDLARIASIAGDTGEWTAVAAEHERIVPALGAGTDPRPALEQLEALVRAHPRYPRAPMLMLALAAAWEREGEGDRALAWLRQAQTIATSPADKLRIDAELVRTLIRTGHLTAAERELAILARTATPGLVINLRKALARAELRRTIRHIMWGLLAMLGLVAALALRRAAGSWRATARRLAHPPVEALFLLPIGAVVIAFSFTGNQLISRTVIAIVAAGIAISWLSGAILDGRPRVGLRRALTRAALAVAAILASVYLAVDRGHVIDFVIETWRHGHERG